jgi:hypothetical protein
MTDNVKPIVRLIIIVIVMVIITGYTISRVNGASDKIYENRIAYIDINGKVWLKTGSLDNEWRCIYEGSAKEVALSGKRIAVLLTTNELLIKEGALLGDWSTVRESVEKFDISDKRILIKPIGDSAVYIKEGDLDNDWVKVYDKPLDFAVSDNRIAMKPVDGNSLLIKEGKISNDWCKIYDSVERFDVSDSRIVVKPVGKGSILIKNGDISNNWDKIYDTAEDFGVTDDMIAVIPKGGNTILVKEKNITNDWKKVCDNAKLVDVSSIELTKSNGNEILNPIQEDILKRAKEMAEYRWTPSKKFMCWSKENTTFFEVGTDVIGLPYTQTEYQTTLKEFIKDLKKDDFYDADYNPPYDERKMPKYGNDCSGFVSFSWNKKRMTTYGIMESSLTKEFPLGYNKLKAGDAFVRSDHTFLYEYTNADGNYVCYEETPPKIKKSVYSPKNIVDGAYCVYRLKDIE